MDPSIDELMEQAVSGSKEALSSLLELHGPALRSSLAGKIPRRLAHLLSEDDVIQETYTDAFLDVGGFASRGSGSFAAWLTTLANRNLLDAIRMLEADKRGGNRRRVQSPQSDDSMVALLDTIEAGSTTPSRHAARREATVALAQAISRLPETYRRTVQLYDLETRSIEEVASLLGRRPGAVFMLRARAHRRLAQLMGRASQFMSGSA